jgi:hypothetical protein
MRKILKTPLSPPIYLDNLNQSSQNTSLTFLAKNTATNKPAWLKKNNKIMKTALTRKANDARPLEIDAKNASATLFFRPCTRVDKNKAEK